ncbi:MAG: peptidyl-prolyl cis-trans isomerase [Candidatus Omnitrophica bacterium]|nr:peptidyl-prolyl cis-trans isomerase [Candidatus Omnitrophota bacterium]
MKRIISFLVLAITFTFSSPALYAQDKVVAIVNNEVITQKDLNDFLNYIRLQYSREVKGKALAEKVEAMRQDLLQRLIEDRIILAQAKIDKISIDPGRVKEKINEIKKRYQSDSEMERDLAKQGLVQADLENKIREQMLMYNIVEQKVRSKVVVWPEEITSFYNQNRRQFLKPEERILTVIILPSEDLAKTVSYQLRVGSKLEDLAAKYQFTTDKLTVAQGQQLRSEIEETVFKLGIREVSNPVKIDAQYYIFRLDDIIGSRQLGLDEAQAKIQVYLFDKKMQDALAKWLDELKKQSYIKILEN